MRQKYMRRILRNGLIIALCLLALWWIKGFPLPTMELELHRIERQKLARESRVIWAYEGNSYNDRDMIVGVGPLYITTYTESNRAYFWPRAVDTPTLVILPERTRYYNKGSYLAPALLAVDAPTLTESAQLTLTLDYDGWSEDYTIAGKKEGSVWFFQLEGKYDSSGVSDLSLSEYNAFWLLFVPPDPDTLSYCPYTLEFFDGDGNLIETTTNPGA